MTEPVTVTVTLSPEQLDAIAERVAELLAERAAPSREEPTAYLTIGEAAGLLGVAPKTVYAMRSDGRLTRHGGPGRALVARDEVLALARGERRESAAEPAQRRRARPRRTGATFTARARGV